MTADIIANIISSVAILISIIALLITLRNSLKHDKDIRLQRSLTSILEFNNSKEKIDDLISSYNSLLAKKQNDSLSKEEIHEIGTFTRLLNTKVEGCLNSLEKGCTLYLSSELDKNHFKSNIIDELTSVYNGKHYKKIIDRSTSKYPSLTKCYEEWNGT